MSKQTQRIQWTQGSFMPFLSCYLRINTKYSVSILYDRDENMQSCTRAARPKTWSTRTFF